MQRILYYIFIYNILFEGFFEGKKPPPTSLLRGERKKLSGISNPPILADTKREMPNEGDCSGRQPRKVDRCGRKEGKKGVLMCEEAFVRKIFVQLRPMEPIRRA